MGAVARDGRSSLPSKQGNFMAKRKGARSKPVCRYTQVLPIIISLSEWYVMVSLCRGEVGPLLLVHDLEPHS